MLMIVQSFFFGIREARAQRRKVLMADVGCTGSPYGAHRLQKSPIHVFKLSVQERQMLRLNMDPPQT